VVIKKLRGISSDLAVTGQWAVVVQHIMNGTGVLKVYLVQTKCYAYCLHFTRAIAPEWVLDHMRAIDGDEKIGFKEEVQPINKTKTEWLDEEDVEKMIPVFDYNNEEEDKIEIIGNQNHAQVVTQSIQSAEDAGQEMSIKQEALDETRNVEDVTEEEEIQKSELIFKRCLVITEQGQVEYHALKLD
jgi:hypothetical protein